MPVRFSPSGKRAIAVAGVLLPTVLFCPAAEPAVSRPECTRLSLPVPLGRGAASMAGTLCQPPGGRASTVQVLLHGSTYNHAYWDFPYRPETYSYRLAMNKAGYATFVVDRLGMGNSTVPPSNQMTLRGEAAQAHEVVQKLRHGDVGGSKFDKVVLGGHSIGAAVTTLEAATYHDVDALLTTGLVHHERPQGIDAIRAGTYSPNSDPKFSGKNYDSGYLTTKPGARKTIYDADRPMAPGVLATDEQTKDVVASDENVDPLAFDPKVSRGVTAPVMLAVGQNDPLYCAPGYADCRSARDIARQEKPDWAGASQFDTVILPKSGHALNLMDNTQLYRSTVRAWADKIVGTTRR